MSIKIVSRWDSSRVLYIAEGAANVGQALEEAVAKGASLTDANLTDANLRGASLRGAYLGGASLRGASANRLTVWPDGFDPATKGVIVR